MVKFNFIWYFGTLFEVLSSLFAICVCYIFILFVLFFSWVGLSFFFFSFIFISWRLITLQYCSGLCHTLTWISHGFTCVPHPDPPSCLSPHPIPLGLPSAPALSTCLMHPTWALIKWLMLSSNAGRGCLGKAIVRLHSSLGSSDVTPPLKCLSVIEGILCHSGFIWALPSCPLKIC